MSSDLKRSHGRLKWAEGEHHERVAKLYFAAIAAAIAIGKTEIADEWRKELVVIEQQRVRCFTEAKDLGFFGGTDD